MKKLLSILTILIIGNLQASPLQEETLELQLASLRSYLERNQQVFSHTQQLLPTLTPNQADSLFFDYSKNDSIHNVRAYVDKLFPRFFPEFNEVLGDTTRLSYSNLTILQTLSDYGFSVYYDYDREVYGLDPIYTFYTIESDINFYPYLTRKGQLFIAQPNESSIENYDRDGLLVSLDELGKRLVFCEWILESFPNSRAAENAAATGSYFLQQLLLCKQENSISFNYQGDNSMLPDVKIQIEAFAKTYPYSRSTGVINGYLELAKANNYHYNDLLDSLTNQAITYTYFGTGNLPAPFRQVALPETSYNIKSIENHIIQKKQLLDSYITQLDKLPPKQVAKLIEKNLHTIQLDSKVLEEVKLLLTRYAVVHGDTDRLSKNDLELLALLHKYDIPITINGLLLNDTQLQSYYQNLFLKACYQYADDEMRRAIDCRLESPISSKDGKGLLVSIIELAERIVKREQLATYNSHLAKLEKQRCCELTYELLLCSKKYTAAFDEETKQLQTTAELETIAKRYPQSMLAHLVRSYLSLLEENNNAYTPQIEVKTKQLIENSYSCTF